SGTSSVKRALSGTGCKQNRPEATQPTAPGALYDILPARLNKRDTQGSELDASAVGTGCLVSVSGVRNHAHAHRRRLSFRCQRAGKPSPLQHVCCLFAQSPARRPTVSTETKGNPAPAWPPLLD